ncbi:uncharacterized protein F4807DRAFT_121310 [Annulohypoxylon truncatum]|uniref:uncharacterized protein n=1 Tax=Annulohypoxylon truncatum TaxID=327061 RepID=UPI0020084120|nr:uncharacterized protein F4807DRAFT_121310 [Annulohypoxylon truncatum]KAI1214309.1 hypothetical protein F4807DRAFT_121310 [Annulohypoxylon truncatum]
MTTKSNLVFRIVYNSIYFLLCCLLAALLLVVPGDFVRQVLVASKQYINLIVLAIVFVITGLIILFVYSLRLYVTRTVLASIPKTWIPTEKGDCPKEVRKMIATDLSRSAAIAWGAYPKVIAPATRAPSLGGKAEEVLTEGNVKEERKSLQLFRSKPPTTVEEKMGILLPSLRPVWGEVEHDGWGSPDSPDLANLQYSNVVAELPNLIEAKAVTQAPPDPESAAIPPTLDADAVALLRRSPNMTMRDYVTHLISVGVLPSSRDAFSFVDSYERARFSTRPLSNAQFRQLMHLFAELLRSIRPLDTGSIYHGTDDAYSESDGHIDDDAPNTTPTTPARSNSSSLSLRSGSSIRSRARKPNLAARNSSSHTWNQYRTAPTTPRSKAGGKGLSHTSSTNSGSSFAQARLMYSASHTSSSSLRSASQTSVIRLATREDRGDLPYVLRVGEAY